jgi:hypothetical protein
VTPASETGAELSDALQRAAQNVPPEVAAWLGRLVLLYGVPFNYLIPEEAMLPKESIRFFFLDPIWIRYLVQGACSIGRNGYGDTIIDDAMNKWVQPHGVASDEKPGVVNKAAGGIRDGLRNQHEGVPLPAESEDLKWPITGFLLRSAVVSGWRGLEIMAYVDAKDRTQASPDWTEEQKSKFQKENVAPLRALRIEQLTPDVMLGVFNGIIAQLVIRQPQEALHFGLTRDGEQYSKTPRRTGLGDASQAGQVMTKPIVLSGTNLMREARGVVDIAALAARMQTVLAAAGQLSREPASLNKFTSAEFAVQMIEAAGQFTFIPKPPSTPP